MILDKEILNYNVLGVKKFETCVSKPFNNLTIDFLSDFSIRLRKLKKIKLFPDLIYLIFWLVVKIWKAECNLVHYPY